MAFIDPDAYLTASELATLLGVTPSAVSNWRKRGILPEPELEIKGMALWSLVQASAVAKERRIDLAEVIARDERRLAAMRRLASEIGGDATAS